MTDRYRIKDSIHVGCRGKGCIGYVIALEENNRAKKPFRVMVYLDQPYGELPLFTRHFTKSQGIAAALDRYLKFKKDYTGTNWDPVTSRGGPHIVTPDEVASIMRLKDNEQEAPPE